jgi:shikimate kinase
MERGIYLVGFSGSGKSTIAQLIGERLAWQSCDLDELIVERSGMSIPLIFEKEGEAGFRARETEALIAASSQGKFVIATGGGIVVREENRAFMAENGWMICLEAQPETLLGRMQEQRAKSDPRAARPMLDDGDPLEKIRSLKQARQAAYALAHWTVHTDRLTGEQVVEEVIRAAEILNRSLSDRSQEHDKNRASDHAGAASQ